MLTDNNADIIVSEKEKRTVARVLERYNYTYNSISKIKNVYKIETDSSLICLNKFKHGKNKTKNLSFFIDKLKESGFQYIVPFHKTANGNNYVSYDKYFYYITDWIDGTECILSNKDDYLKAAQLLANFHLASSKINMNHIKFKNSLKDWPKYLYNCLLDLERFKKVINKKIIRNEFDNVYMAFIDQFYERGLTALNLLNSSNYYKLSKSAGELKTVCHESFYYRNIIKKENNFYFINLDSITIDLQIIDLAKFIRTLISKGKLNWNMEKVNEIIDAYAKIKQITKEEFDILLAIIIFPYKFWKLGKRRYIKHKSWSENKYIKKLNKVVVNNREQQLFIEEFIKYLKYGGTFKIDVVL